MALTLSSDTTSAEAIADQRASIRVTLSDEILRWSEFTIQSTGTLDTNVPQTYLGNVTAPFFYWTGRHTNGKAYVGSLNMQTVAHWALPLAPSGGVAAYQLDGSGAAASYKAMRYGLMNVSGAAEVYVCVHDGSGIQLRHGSVDSVMGDFGDAGIADCGSVFGPAFSNTSSLVRRVEAICPTSDGSIIVAVGSHDFDNGFSTIQFWWVEPTCGDAHQLDAIIYADLTDTYTTWYGCAKWATYISAVYDLSSHAVRVVANGHPDGQAVTFAVSRGVCTAVRPIIPVDPRYGDTTFRPASISVINELMLLTGRYVYHQADGSTLAFDCFLTSLNGITWSFGERNFAIATSGSRGTILADDSASPVMLYYGGNGTAQIAEATPQYGYNSDTKQLAVVPLPGWDLTQGVNAPNTLTFSVIDPDGTLFDSALLTRGTVVYLKAGLWSTFDDIAAFTIDAPAEHITFDKGREAVKMTARDLGNKSLARHILPLALDYRGLDTLSSDMADLTGLVLQTPTSDTHELKATDTAQPDLTTIDHVFGDSGLQDKALNNPLITFADLAEEATWVQTVTVETPDTGDTTALPAVALLWGGTDDGFLGYIIPRASSWASTKVRPRVVTSNLKPFDGTTGQGPYQFPAGSQGLWVSNNYDSGDSALKYLQATLEAPDHYGSEGDFSQSAGEVRDYCLQRSGRRLQLFSRVHDYALATVATRVWTPISSYTFTDDARMEPAERTRLGLAVNTDTWSKTTVFTHAAYADQELGLTSAVSYLVSSQFTTPGMPPGVHHFAWQSGDGHYLEAFTSLGGAVHIDLRTYYYPGQVLWETTTGVARTIVAITTDGTYYNVLHLDNTITNGNRSFNIASGYDWAQASSSQGTTTVWGDTLWLDPHPIKATKLLTGWGVFIANNPTDILFDDGWIDSDGVNHYRLDKGWDISTNPIAAPNSWKLMLHHNVVGKFRASDENIPSSGRMRIEHENVRYRESSYQSRPDTLGDGVTTKTAPVAYVTDIPTYYAIPQTQGAPDTTVKNYTTGTFPTTQDDLGHITDAAGMLFEATGRSAGSASSDVPNVYVTGNGNDAGDSNRGYVTIDTLPATGITVKDMVIVSGRGQLGTKKTTHASDAAVCFWPQPISATELADSLVTVSHYGASSGLYRSVEDAIRYLCVLAGVRNVITRNCMTGAYATDPVTLTLTTSPQDLPLVAEMQDFDLRMNAHITSAARLYIDIRGIYRLSIAEDGGALGSLNIGLLDYTNTFGITADGSGDRWISKVHDAYVSPIELCPAASDTVALRVSVVDESIIVRVNGVNAWTFDLSVMHTDDGATDYSVVQPGPISLSYSASVADNSNQAWVPELWMPIRPIVQGAGGSTASTLRTLMDRYHVRARMQPGGALEFAQFLVRDAAGTTAQGLPLVHEPTSDDSQPATHVSVIGSQSGQYLNTALLASEGYSYKSVSVEGITSVGQAQVEAQLISRESAEFARQATLEGVAKLAHQPEDGLTVAYGTPPPLPPPLPADVPWYKAGGISDGCILAAYLAANVDSYAQSLQDLTGNGHTLSLGMGAPFWHTDTGWVFDGTWFLRTGVSVGSTWAAPANRTTPVPCTQSLLVCFDSLQNYPDGTHLGILAGAIENYGVLYVGNFSSTSRLQFGNMFTFQSDPAITFSGAGGVAIVAGDTLYMDAVANKTETFGTTLFNGPAEAYIGAGNRHGTALDPVRAHVKAVVIYDCVLSPDQITAVTEALSVALAPATDNWWLTGGIDAGDCLIAYQPLCATDFDTSLVNLNNPGTRDATVAGSGAGVDFDPSYGWNFNDPLSWLDTHQTQGASFTNRTILVRVSANLGWGQFVLGSDVTGGDPLNLLVELVRVSHGSGPFTYTIGVWFKAGALAYSASAFDPYDTGIAVDYDDGLSEATPFPPTNSFVIGISATAFYINGETIAYTGDTNTTGATADVLIGASDQSGGNVGPLVQALAMYSRALNAAEVQAVSEAMLALSCAASESSGGTPVVPILPPTDHVITSIQWRGDGDSIRATYKLRRAWSYTGPSTTPSEGGGG